MAQIFTPRDAGPVLTVPRKAATLLGPREKESVPVLRSASGSLWRGVVWIGSGVGIIVIGLAIGRFWTALAIVVGLVAVFLARKHVDARFELLTSLLRTLVPLVLPFLVLVGAAVFVEPRLLSVLVLFALVFIAYKVVALDGDSGLRHVKAVGEKASSYLPKAWRPISLAREHPHASGLTVIVTGSLVLIALLIFAVLTVSTSPWFDGSAGNAAALARSGLVFWGIALIACLVGFATSHLRALVALALFLLAVRFAMYVGFLPGEDGRVGDTWSKALSVWLVLAIVVLCVGIEWAGQAGYSNEGSRYWFVSGQRALRSLARKRPELQHARGIGLIGSIVASITLAVAIGWGVHETRSGAGQLTEGRGLSPSTELPPQLWPAVLDDSELASTFAPVLVLTEAQRWRPVSVNAYVADARLIPAPSEASDPLGFADLPRECEGNATPPCFQLTIDCDTADCVEANDPPRRAEPGTNELEEGTAYVRVLRKNPNDRESTEEEQFVFAFPGPPIFGKDEAGREEDIEILVQYWLFYRYDEWSAATPFGRLVQRHEADWEAITVGFSDKRPLFVAYSAHCGGSSQQWEAIEVASDDTRLHPLVAVAEGSQANYDDSEVRRPPDWASCLGIPSKLVSPLTYIWNIEDVTADDRRVELRRLVLVTSSTPPMDFPGSWGAHDQTVLYNGRRIRLGSLGHGPLSPPLQPLWADPISTIFCLESWRNRDCRPGYVRPREERPLVEFLDSTEDSS
jgi:hypothetical protein